MDYYSFSEIHLPAHTHSRQAWSRVNNKKSVQLHTTASSYGVCHSEISSASQTAPDHMNTVHLGLDVLRVTDFRLALRPRSKVFLASVFFSERQTTIMTRHGSIYSEETKSCILVWCYPLCLQTQRSIRATHDILSQIFHQQTFFTQRQGRGGAGRRTSHRNCDDGWSEILCTVYRVWASDITGSASHYVYSVQSVSQWHHRLSISLCVQCTECETVTSQAQHLIMCTVYRVWASDITGSASHYAYSVLSVRQWHHRLSISLCVQCTECDPVTSPAHAQHLIMCTVYRVWASDATGSASHYLYSVQSVSQWHPGSAFPSAFGMPCCTPQQWEGLKVEKLKENCSSKS